eukprot:14611555-Alexandrium_andersonii.AAC.1
MDAVSRCCVSNAASSCVALQRAVRCRTCFVAMGLLRVCMCVLAVCACGHVWVSGVCMWVGFVGRSGESAITAATSLMALL